VRIKNNTLDVAGCTEGTYAHQAAWPPLKKENSKGENKKKHTHKYWMSIAVFKIGFHIASKLSFLGISSCLLYYKTLGHNGMNHYKTDSITARS